MPKWIVHVDWQGKCEQRGASPGNNDFGDFPPPADVSGLGRRRYGGRGPEPASPGKVGARWWEDWVGSGGVELGTELPGVSEDRERGGRCGEAGGGEGGRGRGEEEGVRGRTCRRSPPLCLLRDWEQRGEL